MRNFISKIETILYERIFKEKISLNARAFIKNLEHIAIGYGIAAFFIFSFQIIAGRILGPTEYGKYVLVDSIALILQILMILGFSTAALKYNAEKSDPQRRRKIISTSYWMVLSFSLISLLFFFVFSSQFSSIFSVSPLIFHLSIIFAFSFVLYTLSTDTLRGLHRMKELALFRVGYGLITLMAFLVLISSKYISFITVVFSISFAYLIIFLLITLNLRKYISFQFDKFWASKFFKYGMYAVIGGISFAFLPAFSKIIINKHLTTTDVGIYNAYYLSSIAAILFFSKIFITVFFPTVSKYQKREPIFRRIRKLLPYLFLIGTPAFFGIEWIVLTLYGKEYPIDYYLMLLFAFTSIVIVIYGLYNWLFCSEGMSGVRLVASITIVIIVINILLSLYLIPLLALYGAVISLLATYSLGVIFLLFFQKRIL